MTTQQYKTVTGDKVLEYLMAGCRAAPQHENNFIPKDQFIVLRNRWYENMHFTYKWQVDESTRKKENLSFKEALIAMEHGHCVRDSSRVYKLERGILLFWWQVKSLWCGSEHDINEVIQSTFSIVPDPSVKTMEQYFSLDAISYLIRSTGVELKGLTITSSDGKKYKLTEVE